MEVGIFSDLHIYRHLGLTQFEDIARDFLIYLFDCCKKRKITTLFFLGDFFHVKNKLYVPSFVKAVDILRSIREAGIKIHFLIGNHDAPQMGTTDHSIMFAFEDYGEVISLYDWIELDDTRFHFLSYTKELPAFQMSDEKKNVLLGHLDINDFVMDTGFVCQEGFSQSNFDKFDLVLSGHFHKHQIKKNIVFVGSPYQTRFSERFDDKGFIILDTKDLSWKFNFYKNAPVFKEIDIEDYNPEELKGNFVRIKTHKDNLDLSEIKNKLLEHGAETVDFIFEGENEEKELTVIEDLNMGTMKELASSYWDNIHNNKMFKKEIKELVDNNIISKKDFMAEFEDIEEACLSGWKPEEE